MWYVAPSAPLGGGSVEGRRRRTLCADIQVSLAADAYVAALAIEQGCELATTDSDFARFKGLRWRYPLGAQNVAERVGFEPTLPFRVNTLSKRAPSATRPSLRIVIGQACAFYCSETRVAPMALSGSMGTSRKMGVGV